MADAGSQKSVWALWIIALVLIFGSIGSTIGAEQWWVRIWDFPRFQICLALLLSAISLWFIDKESRPWLPTALVLVAMWQFYRVYPYTPLAPPEVAQIGASQSQPHQCFTMMSFNVLQDNRDYARTIAMLEREDPDVLLLMETDEKWQAALEPVLGTYPQQTGRVLDNRYGLILATRFRMTDASIQDLTEPQTPSVYATVELPDRPFYLIGLHPRPPRPGQDTDERDAELVIAARHARAQEIPVLAVGDFNDVAWSDTSRLFKRIGGLLDPRIGRGGFATFPADNVWLGWPLDHLFVSEDFLLDDIRVLENVGSDHRPIVARLCLAPEAAPHLNDEPETPDGDDRADAVDIIEEYREDAAEDALLER